MVQRSEAGESQSPERPISRSDSHLARFTQKFRYGVEGFDLAGRKPVVETINEYGWQDASFFVAPKKPEFSVRKLNKAHEKLVDELELSGSNDASQLTEKTPDGGLRFGFIRTKDPLVHIEGREHVEEFEEGAARHFGFGDGEATRSIDRTIERTVWVKVYPHIALAEVARYVTEDNTEARYYLGGLRHSINKEQLALFRRLTEGRRMQPYEIRDALIAKELEKALNEMAARFRTNVTVGSRVSIDI